jgi:hypothetical protein
MKSMQYANGEMTNQLDGNPRLPSEYVVLSKGILKICSCVDTLDHLLHG